MDVNGLNSLINKIFRQELGSPPRIKYWRDRKNNMYAYTSDRGPDGKFYTLYYKYHRATQKWILKRKAGFKRKKVAIARANKWYEQAEEYYNQLEKAKRIEVDPRNV